MQKSQIFKNAGMSTVQILIVTGSVFFLYRFLLETLGAEGLGIWSLVLASTSLTQAANMGISGAVVKFVAKYFTRDDQENINGIIQTALSSLAVAIGLALIIAYPLCTYILSKVMPSSRLPAALAILPHALFAIWIMMTGSVIQSGLEGIQRNDLGSISQVIGTLVYLVLCLLLVRRQGLVGLAWAKIIQNFFLVFLNYIFLKKSLPSISLFPLKWEKRLFREMIGYSATFQAMSLLNLLYDPMTRALISKFGGLSLVGYYEMAARMVTQLRSIIISANGVIVPVIAELQEKSPERVKHLYLTSYQILVYLALPSYSLLIVSIPLISEIWLGYYEPMFAILGSLLSVGWFLNILNGPAYFTYLGTGELRWNLLSTVVIAILNPLIGVILGMKYGAVGVVTAWVFALAVGSSIIFLSFHLKNGIPLREFLPKSSRLMATVCAFGIISSLLVQWLIEPPASREITNISLALGFLVLLSVSLWFHPIRYRLLSYFGDFLKKAPEVPDKTQI